ncbi:hypothetical protein WA026_000071 [Henosepilachna vigintioctopunctata]|uniref:VLRF1 domain-containing protein n=1 Tax=Henosepilachna vigintioctopunctata TaxID=420089 RepID=A0AAW1UWA9_9CUCU
MEVLNVFEKKFEDIIRKEIKSVLLENTEENVDKATEKLWESQTMNSMSCSYCRIDFSDVTTQREHYKLDWHRFNLKQSLLGKTPITEQEFNVKNGNDDISSISGSDSEKEDTLDSFATAQGKIFLQNGEGHTFSLHKCLIFNKKDEIDEKVLLNRLNECCVRNKQWTVFMLGGGHFAGAVFKGNDPILHKTFHCYTVRQGQGGFTVL